MKVENQKARAVGKVLAAYISEPALARELRKSTYTVAHMRKNGRGPVATKIGRTVLYSRAAIDEWLRALAK
jgi:predicted DNA-binding transcriptional regulator AlpA